MIPVLINHEVIEAARGMSVALLGTLVTTGIALWLFGWHWHRFWITISFSLTGALVAWSLCDTWTSTPRVVCAVIVGLTIASVAVELSRLLVFLAGIWAVYWLIQPLAGQFHDLWLLCPLGGLLAIGLFRYGWMLGTSIVGTLVAAHAALLLIETGTSATALPWVVANSQLCTIALGLWVVLGFVMQLWIDRQSTQTRLDSQEPAQPTHLSVLIPVEQQHKHLRWWHRLFAKKVPGVKP
jgi:hypothetical protein